MIKFLEKNTKSWWNFERFLHFLTSISIEKSLSQVNYWRIAENKNLLFRAVGEGSRHHFQKNFWGVWGSLYKSLPSAHHYSLLYYIHYFSHSPSPEIKKNLWKNCIFSRIFSIDFQIFLIFMHIFEKLPYILGLCPILQFRPNPRKSDPQNI